MNPESAGSPSQDTSGSVPAQGRHRARTPTESEQRTARIFGLWFLATFVTSIPAYLLYEPVLNEPDYVLGSGDDAQVQLGALLEIFLAISNIATAVVIFPIVKRVSESIALGYVTLRVIEAAVILSGVTSLLSVVALRDDLAGSDRADDSLVNVAQSLVEFHDQTFLLGPQFCAGFGNGLLLGYLMWRSGLVPRPMALIGLIGGPIAFAGGVGVLFGAWEQPSGVLLLITLPEAIWELSLGILMTVKGFRPSPILTGEPAPAAPSA